MSTYAYPRWTIGEIESQKHHASLRLFVYVILGGGAFSNISIFTPKIGEDEPILTSICFKWVVQPPTNILYCIICFAISWIEALIF